MQIENVFHQLPQVTTDRLILRRARASDVDDIYAYASDPDVPRYTSWVPHTSPEETRQFVRRMLDACAEKRVGNWGIELKAERKLIGTGGYGWWDPEHSSAEIGYVIGKPYWGQGLMTEAVKAMIDFRFRRMWLNSTTSWSGRSCGRTGHSARRVEEGRRCRPYGYSKRPSTTRWSGRSTRCCATSRRRRR